MSKIYVVVGMTGEYEDKCYWPVYAFKGRAGAERLMNRANEWAKENGFHYSNYEGDVAPPYAFDVAEKILDQHRDWIKDYIDYTGVRWYIMEVELKHTSHSPKVKS